MAHPFKAEEQRSRLLARLVREILALPEAAEFEGLADVVEALKYRCARLKIGWTNDDIDAALRLVVSNVPLPGARARREAEQVRREAEQERTGQRVITRAEASAILQRLGVRL